MAEDQEKKYRRISWVTALAVQLVLLAVFYFLIAWKEPFPPIPSYGVELAFGLENVGSGTQPVSTPQPAEEVMREEPIEESSDESTAEESVETEAIDDTADQAEESAETPLSEEPSPDQVEATNTEPSSESAASESAAVEESPETIEPTQDQTEESPTNEEAIMPNAEKGEENNSKGTTNKEGQEGKEEGTLDGRALMGDQGTADGASLQMAGWVWDFQPDPKDNSSEEGKIVYQIKVDEDGYIIGLELVSSTVSPSVERFYRQSIERLSFSKTNDYRPAPTSSGTITFIIRSK